MSFFDSDIDKNISEFLIYIINYCEDSRIVVGVSNQLCVYISIEMVLSMFNL